MMPRGTMRPVKKVLGVINGIIGFFLLVKPEAVSFIPIQLIGILMLVAAYFLIIAGRRW